jgi:hypothetical protein
MSLLALLLLLFLGLFTTGGFAPYPGASESQACMAEAGGAQRCSPTLVDGEYQLPASGTVIRAVVNNGSLPPEFQQGYEIAIDATGRATVVVTPEGASPDLGDQRSADQIVTSVDLGTDGLQLLLHALDSAGYFFLPTRAEVEAEGAIAGDTVSVVEVALQDATWEISGSGMDADDRARLDDVQVLLAAAVGLDPADPTGASV